MRCLLVVLAVAAASRADDPLDAALSRLRTAPHAQRAAAVDAVLALEPDADDVVRRLRAGVAVTPLASGWHVLQARDDGGVARPFHLYVPRAADRGPLPLLVYLHGGVGRPDYPGRVSSYCTMWTPAADEQGFAIAYPECREDCMWWLPAGAAHVRAVVREAKRLVPVDDDAVVATGFSDGGSGCYYLAMAEPGPFAAFLPMNGHPAVAASASGKQLYLRNLGTRPLFCAMTQDDALYPAVTVLEHLDKAMRAGVSIRIVSYETGNHRPVYFEDQQAAFVAFVTGAQRSVPERIDWWCASTDAGRVAWAEVLELGAAESDADAVPDLNVVSTPGRVRLGFQAGTATGPGVAVASVSAGTTAERIGLHAGDVVVGLDGTGIATTGDLLGALERKQHGTPVVLTVRRGEGTVELRGDVPPFEPRSYYVREHPTARLTLVREGDTLRVASRHVRRFRVHLQAASPPHTVRNGTEVAGAVERYALRTILERYAREADKGAVYVAHATYTLPAFGD